MRAVLIVVPALAACPSAPDRPFPEDFLWGTATASWQAEGDWDPDPADGLAIRSNWTVWTERGCVRGGQTNPIGVGFQTQYEADYDRAVALGHNAYRLTVDWTRVEPADDAWSQPAIDHTVAQLRAARERGLEPMVTLYHWVTPAWLQNPTGGADQTDAVAAGDAGPDSLFVREFEEFVRRIAPEIAPWTDLYSIINEPYSVIAGGYLNGGCGDDAFPPGAGLSLDGARRSATNLLFAHAAACHALRELDGDDADGDGAAALCGDAASNNVVRPVRASDEDDVAGAARLDWIYNRLFQVAMTRGDVDLDFDGAFTTTRADMPSLPIDEGRYDQLAGTLDWHGINYYGPVFVEGLPGSSIGGLPTIDAAEVDPSMPRSSLGFGIDPDGLGEILDSFADEGMPLYITENGLGDPTDANRPRYLVEHVDAIQAAIARGVDVRGYLHWSLTDNFEWAHGFDQRFGLFTVDVDDPDRARRKNRSADAFEAIVQAGGVDDAARATWADADWTPLPAD